MQNLQINFNCVAYNLKGHIPMNLFVDYFTSVDLQQLCLQCSLITYLTASDIYFLYFWWQYLDIFLTRVDGLRRRISCSAEMEDRLDFTMIRVVFKVCFSCLLTFLLSSCYYLE